MSKEDNDFTGQEVCQRVGVSSAWLWKMEDALNLRRSSSRRKLATGASGAHGAKSSYTSAEVEFFRMILLLRTAHIPLSELKEFCDLEVKIFNFAQVEFDLDEEEGEDIINLNLQLMSWMMGPTGEFEFSKDKFDSNSKKQAKKEFLELRKKQAEIWSDFRKRVLDFKEYFNKMSELIAQ